MDIMDIWDIWDIIGYFLAMVYIFIMFFHIYMHYKYENK